MKILTFHLGIFSLIVVIIDLLTQYFVSNSRNWKNKNESTSVGDNPIEVKKFIDKGILMIETNKKLRADINQEILKLREFKEQLKNSKVACSCSCTTYIDRRL